MWSAGAPATSVWPAALPALPSIPECQGRTCRKYASAAQWETLNEALLHNLESCHTLDRQGSLAINHLNILPSLPLRCGLSRSPRSCRIHEPYSLLCSLKPCCATTLPAVSDRAM